MIDLTTDEQDNSSFVTKVELNDDVKTYTVTYADGHTVVKDFTSVHNFNADVYIMEQQYHQYRDSFNNEMTKWYIETIKKCFVELAITIIGIMLEIKYIPSGLIRTLMIVLTVLFSLGYQLLKIRDIVTIGYATDYLDQVDRFLKVQERLKVPVKDPISGKDDEWYIANLSSINIGANASFYERYADCLEDPDLREEESNRLTKTLKGE